MDIIVSTAYLPPISYIALLVQKKNVILEVTENFEKQSYRNRCLIYGPNGIQKLTVPVVRDGKTRIDEIKISYHENWTGLHWKSLESAYKGRPFFDILSFEIKRVLDSKPEYLIDLNNQLLKLIMEWIQEFPQITYSTKFLAPENYSIDLRNQIHPKRNSILQNPTPYFQHFQQKHGFISDLSVIDLIFSEGRAAWDYLNSCNLNF